MVTFPARIISLNALFFAVKSAVLLPCIVKFKVIVSLVHFEDDISVLYTVLCTVIVNYVFFHRAIAIQCVEEVSPIRTPHSFLINIAALF